MLSRRHLVLGAAATTGLAACMQTVPVPSYVLFFTAFSTDLSADALTVIKDAAQAARRQGNSQLVVEGYADRAGSPAANVSLSLKRAERVADALVENGVARERILLEPKGSGEDPGIASRRVEIEVKARP